MPSRKASSPKQDRRQQETYTVAVKAYEKSMNLFHKKKWAEASAAFDTLIAEFGNHNDVSELVDRARVHKATCTQMMTDSSPQPASAEEWLLHGVAQANDHDIEAALSSFEQAESAGVQKARVTYARAAAYAVVDRQEEALAQLAAAIEADPENRSYSLGDPDFERLRETAGYVSLVEPPAKDDEPETGLSDLSEMSFEETFREPSPPETPSEPF